MKIYAVIVLRKTIHTEYIDSLYLNKYNAEDRKDQIVWEELGSDFSVEIQEFELSDQEDFSSQAFMKKRLI